MTRALPRTNFNSSGLLRFLADLALVEPTEPGYAFAEKLGLWLDFTDAITLFAVHDESTGSEGSASPSAVPATGRAAAAEFARGRAGLVNSIVKSCTPQGGESRIKLPTPQTGVALEIAAAYEPYRRFYLALQRDMELNVAPLRARLRQTLAQAAPALKQLADLDAALDGILAEREGKLLATLPWLLEKRFEQLLEAHRQTLAASGQADDPALWLQAGGWLAVFCRDLQSVLLAELDLRLQPAQGLMEAFSNEVDKNNE